MNLPDITTLPDDQIALLIDYQRMQLKASMTAQRRAEKWSANTTDHLRTLHREIHRRALEKAR